MGISKCINLYKEKQLQESAECFGDLLKTKPESHELNYCMGVVLFESGDFFSAANYFKKANAIESDSLSVYYTGLCYFNMLDFETAMYFFKQAISQNPMSAEAHFMLSLCCVYNNDHEGFSKFLKRSILLDKDKANAMARRFVGIIKAGKDSAKLLPSVKQLLKEALA